ncbi:disintegrin and metalloproteinase domain-containing protein 33-like [Brienomyrus brachyistius]|uniref:disintegrin and metalloproteinase domain-containing protein 33-like n=1 Tax=Brienomyrus brachyistius TaxID=42636 RepID=UPI0020B45E93|nr:disintegrin and metalloproteinase domain-containing protein 33-like [Brienomyrus brachyistius]
MYQQKKSVISAACGRPLICLILLLVNSALTIVNGDLREQGESLGQTVIPYWMFEGQAKREAVFQTRFPARGEILLEAQGKELLLQVERNDQLLGPNFTETHYEDGVPVTLIPDYTDHCYYHGHVIGHSDSWVTLSTCSGVKGLIVLNANNSYYLEPINGLESPHHKMYRTEHLRIQGGTCGHEHQTEHPGHFSDFLQPLHRRMRRNTQGSTKYMELYIVADHTLFKRQNDLGITKRRIIEVANYVDKFYRALNIRVPLIGLEVWTERDQCIVTEDPKKTLWSFLQWRQKLKSRKKHDNAQLLTGVIFTGTTIGMAPLEGMCSLENSGGINVDHSDLPIGAAATMAHEIGHNFGMSHDNEGCCVEATAKQGGCMMNAATGHPFPRVFSQCSKRDLDGYFQKGGGMCVFNMPNVEELVEGRRCGNGFVESGEECDCGEPEECTNACCNAKNCTLKAGVQCAHGVCCENCKLKLGGTLCRAAAGACDLPEYCTGALPYCPSNVYLMDGSLCQNGRAYCYNGMCLTHEQQCLQLWGPGARPAHDTCFQEVNAAGNEFGNCGKNALGVYVKCEKSDAKCGKIQCDSIAEKPKGSNSVAIDTSIHTDGTKRMCRGTYVYTKPDEQDVVDPGLVMTGTKCGDGKVCINQRCQNRSFSDLMNCLTRCHRHGVCNSNQNCHCDQGWAPPFCDKQGLGGSVDSGPVQYHGEQGLVVGLFLTFLVLVPGVLVLFWCWKVKALTFHMWLSQRLIRNDISDRSVNNGHQNLSLQLGIPGSSSIDHKTSKSRESHTTKENLPLRPVTEPSLIQPSRRADQHWSPDEGQGTPSSVGKLSSIQSQSPAPAHSLTPPKKVLPLSSGTGLTPGGSQPRRPPQRPPPPRISPTCHQVVPSKAVSNMRLVAGRKVPDACP